MRQTDQGVKFGTDGIRGRAGRVPCTPEVGVAVGRAAARLAQVSGRGRVLIGRDTRPSGEMLEAAVTAGAAGQGAQCLLAGVVPTSAVSLALSQGMADAGIVLTASHNPVTDNGFKVLAPGGGKLDDAQVAQIERELARSVGGLGAEVHSIGSVTGAQAEVWERWGDALLGAVPGAQGWERPRIALDLAHGALVPAIPWLAQNLPVDWVFIGDGSGLINDGVGSEHLPALQRAVQANGCALGIAVDGDADRCRIVDEHGEIISGDAVAWLLARGRGVEGMAVTVMSNAALEPSLPGVRVVRTPVGDRHLREAMDAQGLALGSEESGHVLFDDFPAGDGLLTGLRVLSEVLRRGPASEVFAGFRPLPRQQRKVPVQRRPPLEGVEALVEAQRRGEAKMGANSRVFLRYSGTEPVLRVLIEGPDAEVVDAVATEVEAVARQALS